MKYLKKSTLYTGFLTVFGWFMQTVQTDPRIRLAMFFIQAAVHEYTAIRRLAQPQSVDQVVDFLQTAMKPRKKGRDDAILDALQLYLGATRAACEAVDVIKTHLTTINLDFWNLVLVESVIKQGRVTLTMLESQGMVTPFDVMKTNKITNATNQESRQYQMKANFPSDALVKEGIEIIHQASLLIAAGIFPTDVASEMKLVIEELEAKLSIKSGGSSGTAAAASQDTKSPVSELPVSLT